jgi:outer membrane protein OmpA-like peptidoglycan-associated protein
LKKSAIILLFSLFSSFNLLSQLSLSTDDKKAIASFEEALKNYRYGEWEKAEFNYKAAIARDTNFTEAHLELGLLYGERKSYTKAIKSLEQVSLLDADKYPKVQYYLGLFQLNLADYTSAQSSLEKYLATKDDDLKKRENAESMIRKCKFAANKVTETVEFNPVNMGPKINSRFSEYYPCITADESILLYTRQVSSTKTIDGTNEEFFTSIKELNEWASSRNLGLPINTLNNEGAPTLSVDGLLLIFTACPLYGDYGPGRSGEGSCDLFFSQRIGERWSQPRNLGKPVNTNKWESQPSFASDGRTLYFVRGITTQYGIKDQDIYQTYLSDSGWTKPVRLPSPINTPGREESVFIHPDGKTMYFASDGHPGFGGLDIFVSRKDDEGQWSTPKNLGYPINSENDENSLMVNAKGDIGYFASDRSGGYGGLDLYYFEMPEGKKPEKVIFLKGRVFDASTKRTLLAKFELIDLKTGETIIESYSNGGNGEYLVCLPPGRDYALNASKDGYLFYSDNFTLTNEENTNKPVVKDVPLVPIATGAKVVLNNIFFETNKYDLKPESRVELKKLIGFLNTNKGVKIELGGHTDNTGGKELNISLSKNRAKAVYDYLIENGINAERLSYKGYADEEPVASNESAGGRAKNRRTEFKIVGIQP